MNDIHAAWREYERKVIPADATWIQRVECRRAFFRGAGCVLDVLTGLDNNRATDEQKGQAVDAMTREVVDFRQHVAGDRA